MDRIAPDTPFTVTIDDPPVCGVSDRLERKIQLQFVGVLVGIAAAIAVVVAALSRLKL